MGPHREQLARQQHDQVYQFAAVRLREVIVRRYVEGVQQDAMQDDRVRRLVLEQLSRVGARGQFWLHERDRSSDKC